MLACSGDTDFFPPTMMPEATLSKQLFFRIET